MKDATLNDGTTMTDAEFIIRFGLGDAPTDFVATKDDLVSLAHGIVGDLLAAEFHLEICVSGMDIARRNYSEKRLIRLVDYVSELDDIVKEKLRRGREKNDTEVKTLFAKWEADRSKESS